MIDLHALSDERLHNLIDASRRVLIQRSGSKRNLVEDSILIGGTRYFCRRIPCGKASKGKCRKCESGEFHGPYWYKIIKEDKKSKLRYVGPPYTIPNRDPELLSALEERDSWIEKV